MAVRDETALRSELARLGCDGPLDNGIRFQGRDGCCLGGEASITEEEREFLNLIENEGISNGSRLVKFPISIRPSFERGLDELIESGPVGVCCRFDAVPI